MVGSHVGMSSFVLTAGAIDENMKSLIYPFNLLRSPETRICDMKCESILECVSDIRRQKDARGENAACVG